MTEKRCVSYIVHFDLCRSIESGVFTTSCAIVLNSCSLEVQILRNSVKQRRSCHKTPNTYSKQKEPKRPKNNFIITERNVSNKPWSKT